MYVYVYMYVHVYVFVFVYVYVYFVTSAEFMFDTVIVFGLQIVQYTRPHSNFLASPAWRCYN